MRCKQINTSNPKVAPRTHPYTVDLHLDPVDVGRLRQMLDEDEDRAAMILHVDRSIADVWTVTVACASMGVRNALDSAWG